MKTKQELRADDRVDVLLPVQLWGIESEWEPFTEKVEMANVSLSGARMKGLQAQVRLGDVIAIEHAGKKAAFQVVWVGKKGSAHQGEVGIFCLEPAKLIWGTILLSPEMAIAASPKPEEGHAGQAPKDDPPPAEPLARKQWRNDIEFSKVNVVAQSQIEKLIGVEPPGSPPETVPAASTRKKAILKEPQEKAAPNGRDIDLKVVSVKRWVNQRRTERVVIREPISVVGATVQGQRFSEDTETMVVNRNGGLFLLRSAIEFGQKVWIRRKRADADKEVECRVVYVGKEEGQEKEVGVAFTSPNNHFWGIGFPS